MIRRGTVRRLVHQLDRAIAHGDLDAFRRLVTEMVGIVLTPPPDCSSEEPIVASEESMDESTAAFAWLADNDGGLINDAILHHFWRHPDDLRAEPIETE